MWERSYSVPPGNAGQCGHDFFPAIAEARAEFA